MKLALLTCTNLPTWEEDDRFFHAALDMAGIEWSLLAWDSDTDWSTFDVTLIRTTWDYVDRREQFSERLKEIASQTYLVNPVEIVEWNLEKTYLKDLEDAGIPIAPTVWIDEKIDLNEVMTSRGWGRGFLKPVVGACAVDTKRFTVNEIASVQVWLNTLVDQGEKMMLQPYLEPVETVGEYSVIYFGQRLSHCVQKIPVKGDYRVQDDYGASDHPIEPIDYPQMMHVADATLRYLHERFSNVLVIRMDFLKMSDGQFVINEVEMIEPSLFFRHSTERSPQLLLEELLSKYEQVANRL